MQCLTANATTGWWLVGRDRQDARPPVELPGLASMAAGRARRGLRLQGSGFLAMVLGLWFAATWPASGCNVPVFRFALERWVSDNHVLVIAHDKPLMDSQQKIAEQLTAMSCDNGGNANLSVQVLDLAASPDDPAIKYLPIKETPLPAAFLFFPAGFGEPTLIWKAPLTEDIPARLAKSPKRDAFVREAVKGATATWYLLESGRKADDDAAEQVLRECLTAAEQELKLPAGVIHPSGVTTGAPDSTFYDPENQLESGIPLVISFAVVRMSADDVREDVLLGMLMNVTPGLTAKRGKPMAFPIFGRGRILEPLTGDEIRNDNIAAISRYLCGPCSCQVKARNPGVDMLLDENWGSRLAGVTAIAERELPPLSGTAAITAKSPVPPAGDTSQGTAGKTTVTTGMRGVWRVAAAAVLLVIAATLTIMKINP